MRNGELIGSWRHRLSLIILAAFFFAPALALFQNCAPGFQSNNAQLGSFYDSSGVAMSPSKTSVYVGDAATLSTYVKPIEGAYIRYQWKKEGRAISGQTLNSLVLPNAQLGDAGFYTVETRGERNGILSPVIESASVELQVRAVPAANMKPIIVTPQRNLALATASIGYVRASIDGYPAPSVQWFKDDQLLVGESLPYLLIKSATSENSGTYRCVASNSAGIATSDPILISVDEPKIAPKLIEVSSEQRLALKSRIELQALATGLETPTYQWSKDGTNLPAANGERYSYDDATALQSGLYKLTAKNSSGEVTATVQVTVVDGLQFTQTLSNQMVALGSDAVLTTVVKGDVEKLEWFKDGALIAGATTATLRRTATTTDDAGVYKVRATNISGSVESTMTLTVVSPPVLVTGLRDATANVGGSASFSVAVTGTALTYKWYKDNVAIVGANALSYSVVNAVENGSGTYRVDVSNIAGTVTSSAGLFVCGDIVTISDAEEFRRRIATPAANCQQSQFVLKADIDFAGATLSPVDLYYIKFDGENHALKNFTIAPIAADSASRPMGLFGQLYNSTILNVHVSNFKIIATSSGASGGLAGSAYGSSFVNVSANSGTVVGGTTAFNYTGGLVGNFCESSIMNASSSDVVVETPASSVYRGSLYGGCGSGSVHAVVINSFSSNLGKTTLRPQEPLPLGGQLGGGNSSVHHLKTYSSDQIAATLLPPMTDWDFNGTWQMASAGMAPLLRHAMVDRVKSPRVALVTAMASTQIAKGGCIPITLRHLNFAYVPLPAPSELDFDLAAHEAALYPTAADCTAKSNVLVKAHLEAGRTEKVFYLRNTTPDTAFVYSSYESRIIPYRDGYAFDVTSIPLIVP